LRRYADTGTYTGAHTDSDACSDTDAHSSAHTDANTCSYSDAHSCADAYTYAGSDTCSDPDRQLPAVRERPYVCDWRQGHQRRQLLSMYGRWMVLIGWRV